MKKLQQIVLFCMLLANVCLPEHHVFANTLKLPTVSINNSCYAAC